MLTRTQAIFLDAHFVIEHTARNRSGRFMHFNGTAGVWRRSCIDDAGGWQHDTLTEDLDLSYRAQLKGSDLELSVGFSHPVTVTPREGISFDVPQPTQVIVKGTDKQAVGQTAAEIRKVRPPEPYKGKGIRYQGEHVRRKVGKRA